MSRNTSKGRHLVKCAATGIFFCGLSACQDGVSIAAPNRPDLAEGQADEQAATYLAALLNNKHGSFAWTATFQ